LFFYKTQLLIVRRILVYQINIVYLSILNLDPNIKKCNIGKYQYQNTLIYCWTEYNLVTSSKILSYSKNKVDEIEFGLEKFFPWYHEQISTEIGNKIANVLNVDRVAYILLLK